MRGELEPTGTAGLQSEGEAPAASRAFSVVLVPTLACNCTCEHCFEELTDETLDDGQWLELFQGIRQLAESIDAATLRLYWQGGDVLCMDPGSVTTGLGAAAAVFQNSDTCLEHHMQTNLLLYDTDLWRDVIARFRSSSIGSSLDYPNLYRKTPDLSGDEYLEAWLQKRDLAERDGFSVSVISIPNPETLERGAASFYRFFTEEAQVSSVQMNFPFPGRRGSLQPLDLAQLAGFMADLYGIWVASARSLKLSPFTALEDRLVRGDGTLPCVWAGNCAHGLLAVGPNGDVAQCDCWLSTFTDYGYGSLWHETARELLDSPGRRTFLERPEKLVQETVCGECPYWHVCHGGCPVRAYAFTGDLHSPDHYCPVYRTLFSTILEEVGPRAPVSHGDVKGRVSR